MADEDYGDDEFVTGDETAEMKVESTAPAATELHSQPSTEVNGIASADPHEIASSLPFPPPPPPPLSHDLPQSPSSTAAATVVSPASSGTSEVLTDASAVRINRHAGGLRALTRQEKQTIKECKKSIREDATFIEPYVVLARLYNRVGDHVSTFRVLEDGLSKFPSEGMFRHLIKVFNMQYSDANGGSSGTSNTDTKDDEQTTRKRSSKKKKFVNSHLTSPTAASVAASVYSPSGAMTERVYTSAQLVADYPSGANTSRSPLSVASSCASNYVSSMRTSLAAIRRDAARQVGWEEGSQKKAMNARPTAPSALRPSPLQDRHREQAKEKRLAGGLLGPLQSSSHAPSKPHNSRLQPPPSLASLGLMNEHTPTKPLKWQVQSTLAPITPLTAAPSPRSLVQGSGSHIPVPSYTNSPSRSQTHLSPAAAAASPSSLKPSSIPMPTFGNVSPRTWGNEVGPLSKSATDPSDSAPTNPTQTPRPPPSHRQPQSSPRTKVKTKGGPLIAPLKFASPHQPADESIPMTPQRSTLVPPQGRPAQTQPGGGEASVRTRLLRKKLSMKLPGAVKSDSPNSTARAIEAAIEEKNSMAPESATAVDASNSPAKSAPTTSAVDPAALSRRRALRESAARRADALLKDAAAERERLLAQTKDTKKEAERRLQQAEENERRRKAAEEKAEKHRKQVELLTAAHARAESEKTRAEAEKERETRKRQEAEAEVARLKKELERRQGQRQTQAELEAAEAEALAHAQAEARAAEEAERVRAEAEAKAKAEADEKAKAEADIAEAVRREAEAAAAALKLANNDEQYGDEDFAVDEPDANVNTEATEVVNSELAPSEPVAVDPYDPYPGYYWDEQLQQWFAKDDPNAPNPPTEQTNNTYEQMNWEETAVAPTRPSFPAPLEDDWSLGPSVEQHTAALKIQQMFRHHRARRQVREKRAAIHQAAAKAGVSSTPSQRPPHPDTLDHDFSLGPSTQEHDAAVKIQLMFRHHQARKRVRERRAAIHQAAESGAKSSAKERPPFPHALEHDFALGPSIAEHNAATKIQCMFRHHQARKRVRERRAAIHQAANDASNARANKVRPPPPHPLEDDFSLGPSIEEHHAAIKIQLMFRHHQARKRVRERKAAIHQAAAEAAALSNSKADTAASSASSNGVSSLSTLILQPAVSTIFLVGGPTSGLTTQAATAYQDSTLQSSLPTAPEAPALFVHHIDLPKLIASYQELARQSKKGNKSISFPTDGLSKADQQALLSAVGTNLSTSNNQHLLQLSSLPPPLLTTLVEQAMLREWSQHVAMHAPPTTSTVPHGDDLCVDDPDHRPLMMLDENGQKREFYRNPGMSAGQVAKALYDPSRPASPVKQQPPIPKLVFLIEGYPLTNGARAEWRQRTGEMKQPDANHSPFDSMMDSSSASEGSAPSAPTPPSELIWLQCSDEVLRRRMEERLDDESEIAAKLNQYHTSILPPLQALEQYVTEEIVHKVDGEREPDVVAQNIHDILNGIRVRYAQTVNGSPAAVATADDYSTDDTEFAAFEAPPETATVVHIPYQLDTLVSITDSDKLSHTKKELHELRGSLARSSHDSSNHQDLNQHLHRLESTVSGLQFEHDRSALLQAPASMRTLKLARRIHRITRLNQLEQAGHALSSLETAERWTKERERLGEEMRHLQEEGKSEEQLHTELIDLQKQVMAKREELIKLLNDSDQPPNASLTEPHYQELAALENKLNEVADALEHQRSLESAVLETDSEDTRPNDHDSPALKEAKLALIAYRSAEWKETLKPTEEFRYHGAKNVTQDMISNLTGPDSQHASALQELRKRSLAQEILVQKLQIHEDHRRRPPSPLLSLTLPKSVKAATINSEKAKLNQLEQELASFNGSKLDRRNLELRVEALAAHVTALKHAIDLEEREIVKLDEMQAARRIAQDAEAEKTFQQQLHDDSETSADGALNVTPAASSPRGMIFENHMQNLRIDVDELVAKLKVDLSTPLEFVEPTPLTSLPEEEPAPVETKEDAVKAEAKEEEEEEDDNLVMEDGDTIDFDAAERAKQAKEELARAKQPALKRTYTSSSSPIVVPDYCPPPPVLRPTATRTVQESDWSNVTKVSATVQDAITNDPTIFEEYACFRLEVLHLDRVGKLGATKPYVVIQHQRGHIWEDIFKTETLLRDTQSVNPSFETNIIRMSTLNHGQMNRVNRFQLKHQDSSGQDITIGDLAISFEDIVKEWDTFQQFNPDKYAAGLRKVFYLSRSEKNKSWKAPSSENLKKYPQYPELKSLPKTCCGLLIFHDVSIRLKTTPGLLISPTSRLFPIEDGMTDCVVRLNIHGKGLDKMDTLGKSDPFFQIWRLKPGGEVRKAPPEIGEKEPDGGQDDISQYEMIYQCDYIEHTLDPKFPTFVLKAKDLCLCDYDTHLLLRMFDWDLGGDADFIGSCHFTLREIIFANNEDNRDSALTNKRPLIALSKLENDPKKYKNSGVLTFRGCDIFTLHGDVDAEADKSLARTKQVYQEGTFNFTKRQAYLVYMMHGKQLLQRGQSGLGSKKHRRAASENGMGFSSRDVLASFKADSSMDNKRASKSSSHTTTSDHRIAEEDEDGGETATTEPHSSTHLRHGSSSKELTKKSHHKKGSNLRQIDSETEEGDQVNELTPSPKATPASSSLHPPNLSDLTKSMRSAADLFAAARSKDVAQSFTFKCHDLAKPSFFTSPDSYIELLADRKLKGQWESVCTSEVIPSNVNPAFAPIILKQKQFVSSTSHPEDGDSLPSVQIKLWHKSSPPKLLGRLITTFGKLRQPHERGQLLNEKGEPAGLIVTDHVKVVSDAIAEEQEKKKKAKKIKK